MTNAEISGKLSSIPELNTTLMWCGVLSSIWYVAINIFVPFLYDGYDAASLTVSELSAIGAPTRKLWLLVVTPYLILFAAFGWGVLQYSKLNPRLRLVGVLILMYSFVNIYWPPMHRRGLTPTVTDTLHLVWASIAVVLMIAMMSLGARAFNRSFRYYTIISIILLVAFGLLTALEAPNVAVNAPTPRIGIWERINVGLFMVWVIVLSTNMLKESNRPLQTASYVRYRKNSERLTKNLH